MTIAETQARIDKLEEAITTADSWGDLSLTRILLLAGEWVGLKESIGQTEEGAWAMLWRTRGL